MEWELRKRKMLILIGGLFVLIGIILNSFSLKEILSRLSAICKFYGYS